MSAPIHFFGLDPKARKQLLGALNYTAQEFGYRLYDWGGNQLAAPVPGIQEEDGFSPIMIAFEEDK